MTGDGNKLVTGVMPQETDESILVFSTRRRGQ